MDESIKTTIYVAIAAVISLAAYVFTPAPPGSPPPEDIGKPLFEDLQDPLAAKSLEVVRYDEDVAEIRRFKVAEIDGVWSIPSHQNYPADAKDQVRDAAATLMDVEVLGVASDVASDHAQFGVVEPDSEKVKPGDKGVGLLVAMQDDKGQDLARLIIGKAVKGDEDQRFVRVPSQDRVYTVKVSPDSLSTDFDTWIETDLLDLNTFDVEQVVVQDYSVQVQGLDNMSYDQRLQLTLDLENNTDWKLVELLEGQDGDLLATKMLEGEELNTERLNKMKDAFDDLKIVDVHRKPKGLGADLRANEDFMNNRESLQSLVMRGFYPVSMGGALRLLSSDGEVLIRTKDGVEYVLRFGQIAGLQEGEADAGQLNRFLFVATRIWDEKYPLVTQLPAGPTPQPVEAGPPEESTEGADTAAGEATDDTAAEADGETAAEADGETAAEADGETAAEADGETAAEADGETADTDAAAEADGDEAEPSADDPERKKQQDEYEDAGRKVAELNDRFADWYYVISEDVFKEIHLARGDIIQEKEGAALEEGFGVDAFRELQENPEQPDGEDQDGEL